MRARSAGGERGGGPLGQAWQRLVSTIRRDPSGPAPRSAAGPEDPLPAGPASRAGRRAVLIAAAVLLAGLALSLSGALQWRASVRSNERQAFQTTATDVSQTLETHLRRQADFVSTLNAVMTVQPHLSQDAFAQWYSELEGRERQLGGLGTSVIARVPAAELTAFLRERNSNPDFRAIMGNVVPVPRSGRARYCLVSRLGTVVARFTEEVSRVIQGDWCDPRAEVGSFQAPLQSAAADSGRTVVYPAPAQGGVHTLIFDSAFYRKGAPSATVAQRRAAVEGWVVSTFDADSVMHASVAGNTGLSVALYHRNPGRGFELVGTGGSGARGPYARTTAAQVEGPWRIVVRGAVATSGLGAGSQALLVLLGGAVLSALLAALILVVMRSRAHALDMVAEKTGELQHQALHDGLTGLPNRVLALDRAEQMLARARRQQLPVAALFVDIDGFKQVNDSFGHAAGDELLRLFATRLSGVIREGDTAARLGGDEFIVLVEGSTLDAGPELVAERLIEVLRHPYDLDHGTGRQLSITVSIGVAAGMRDNADILLRDADIALYEAKAIGKNRFTLFHSDMHTLAQDRLTLTMDLSEALEREQLFLLYQPTFDLRSERVIGMEALLRWRHPTRGMLEPERFIPLAEESGEIVPIGRWVLGEACRRAAAWRESGHALGVAVNVSARQLESDVLIDDVRGALAASGLEAGALTLEVTETTLMADAEAAALRLHALKELGVRIAIDDFGTGYSSLAYLRQFPADALKIDRSFVRTMTGSRQSTALVHTLVQLGRSLHLETLAEGIEDERQLRTLRREQCDQGQGFLFSRPLDERQLAEFLSRVPVAAQPRAR